MSTADNIFTQVVTYQLSELAYLQNLCCFISTANTRFKDFNKLGNNLGSTVSFDLPPRVTTTNSLVVSFEAAQQRVETLTVDQQASAAYVVSSQQDIFNLEPMDYMKEFGMSQIKELGTQVEADVANVCLTDTYRFFGDGVTQINSFGQLAKALAFYRNFGAPTFDTKCYLSDIIVPDVVNNGLNQFVMDRNEELAMSWQLGKFSDATWYQSNLLPLHTAGTEGQKGSTLTVVSVTTDVNGAVTAITFSGTNAALDANSVKQYDKFQFQDGVSGQPNMRFLTFIGYKPSSNPVQFQATANAASTGGSQVTVTVNPPLQANAGQNQNINNAIAAGMTVKVLPNHRSGLIQAGNSLFLGMPRLPDQTPFPTGNASDDVTGVSMRAYFGTLFGQNQQGYVHDCIWGKKLARDYGMAIIFPE